MCSLQHGLDEFRPLSRCSATTRSWKYDWEPQHLESSRDFIFRNTFKDIEHVLKELGEGCGTRFEFECYDVGHLYTLAHFLDRGLVKPPLFVQTIFGILGGIGADPENLAHMKRIADKLFGDQYRLVDARRRPPPDAARHHGRDHGRQRARRARGLHLCRQGPAGEEQCRAGQPHPHASSKICRWRSPRRRRRGPCSTSRAATRSRSESCLRQSVRAPIALLDGE